MTLAGLTWRQHVAFALAVLVALWLLDERVYLWAAGLDEASRRTLGAPTNLGKSGVYLTVAGLTWLACALYRHETLDCSRRRQLVPMQRASGFAFALIALSGLITNLIKPLLGRARPKLYEQEGAFAFVPFSLDSAHASMPSGHAGTICSLAVLLCLFSPRWARVPIIALAGYLAFTRVIIKAHYLSDIVAAFWLTLVIATWLAAHHPAGRLFDLTSGDAGKARQRWQRLRVATRGGCRLVACAWPQGSRNPGRVAG